jgi:RecB family exonuclease
MTELLTGYSMVKSYRRCPKQYEFKYKQNLQRKKPAAPLIRGTILHEMLHARATPKMKASKILAEYDAKFGELFREEREEYGEDFLGDIKRVYDGYLREYGSDEKIRFESSEEEISSEITKGIVYRGHIDKRIVTLADSRRWLMDHKTHKSIPEEKQRLTDYQILMYLWCYNTENPKKKADGIVWDYIRTKPPTIPETLKAGGLTQRANLDSDVSTYLRELNRLKLDQKPYAEYLASLAKRERGRFYQRIFLPAPSKAITNEIVTDFIETSKTMHTVKRFPRNLTRDCSWCEYYRLCNAELRGLDHGFVRNAEFEEKVTNEEFAEED